MTKETMLRHLQREWRENNENYSEDGFKEHVCEYCDKHDDVGFFKDFDGKTVAVVDWLLHNLDLSR